MCYLHCFHSHHLTCPHISYHFCSFLFLSVFLFSLLRKICDGSDLIVCISAQMSTLASTPRRISSLPPSWDKLLHPPSLLQLHPHILLQITTKYRVFPLIPHFLTFHCSLLPDCHSSLAPLRSPPVRGLSGVVGLKIKSRNTRISSSTHHPSADSSLTHRLLIQGHECYSLSWKAN